MRPDLLRFLSFCKGLLNLIEALLYRNEQLLHMVVVEGISIEVGKKAPVAKVAQEADNFGESRTLYLVEGISDVLH